jgi:carbonic anhydrase/acetyltransferase-like protein (isoleucine patch superfamily)
MLHGCVVGEGTLIGIGAVVLNGVKIGKDCLIGAGALIPERKEIPDRSVVIGIGKIIRTLTDEEVDGIRADGAKYAEKARNISLNLKRI